MYIVCELLEHYHFDVTRVRHFTSKLDMFKQEACMIGISIDGNNSDSCVFYLVCLPCVSLCTYTIKYVNVYVKISGVQL